VPSTLIISNTLFRTAALILLVTELMFSNRRGAASVDLAET
jgi:hypothetical protein